MTNQQGEFIWYELMTTDADAAQSFYGGLLGWTFADSGTPGMDYRLFSSATSEVGGFMPMTPDMTDGGAQPAWLGYISVDDVDARVAEMQAAGASVRMPPWDIPGVGRLAFLADPQGAMFYVMKPTPPADQPDAVSNSFARYEPMIGHCAWNELATSDPAAAKAFYGTQFGWVQEGAMDMGPMGTYEFLQKPGERPYGIGAVYKKPPEMPVSAWTFYFRVPDIDAGAASITANGGLIIQPPIEIPGGEFSLVASDPQGAVFGLVGLRK